MDLIETFIKIPRRYYMSKSMTLARWIVRSPRTFIFNGKEYAYFNRVYRYTIRNERAIEIPIAQEMVKNCHGNILEVGNVLSHYFPVNYDVVDKYEKANRVINKDILDFKPTKKYDLIICISTLEHIGLDDPETNRAKTLRAIKKLRSMLSIGGKAFVTFPLGQNHRLDELFENGEIAFDKTHYMKKVSWDNRWMETDFEGVKDSKYGKNFTGANGLVIGIIKR